MKRWKLFAVAMIVTLSGCAGTSEQRADESVGASQRVCVNVRNINSFDSIDDRHIYVKALGQQRHFLFTMHGGCTGLSSAHTIAVRDTFNQVCSNSFGEVIYRDMGRGLESCRIRDIEAVASKDDAEGLVKDRKAAKREEHEQQKESSE